MRVRRQPRPVTAALPVTIRVSDNPCSGNMDALLDLLITMGLKALASAPAPTPEQPSGPSPSLDPAELVPDQADAEQPSKRPSTKPRKARAKPRRPSPSPKKGRRT